MNIILFVTLLTAHLIGDFLLQTDSLCEKKRTKKIKCTFLYIHAIIIAILAFVVGNSWAFWPWALLIGGSHLLIDLLKCYKKRHTLLWFIVDQLLHLAVIIVVSSFAEGDWCSYSFLSEDMIMKLSAFLCAALICTKPTNILIKLILEKYDIFISKSSSKEMKNAGALIGSLERLLSLILIIMGQFEAVGFIIAAKSILRFRDYERAKTEYVLAGTLLSFGVALVCGVTIKLLFSL